MRKYTRRLAVPLAVIALVVGSAGVASADNAVGDGDGAVPLSTNNLNFGPTVCLGSTTTKDVALGVIRAGGPGTNTFKNGAIVTLSVTGITGSGLSATLGTPTTITLPGDWTSSANGTTSPTAATARVTLSAATLGPVSGTLSFQASGANTSNATINRGGTVTVTATVVNCDTTPPTLSLPTGLTYEANSSAGAVATWTATAADASPASPAVTCSPTSGSTFALGTTAVSCSATDASGNTATGSFNVTVDDTTPPTIGQPADVEVEAVSSAGATVSYTTPAATDVVDGVVTATCLPASGSMIALGATTVTCAATDAHGNAATTGFTITVADGTAPQLTVPTDVTEEATGPSGCAGGVHCNGNRLCGSGRDRDMRAAVR